MKRWLKRLIPKRVRELRVEARYVWPEFKALNKPAPLDDFQDYEQYWKRRGKMNSVLRRWQVAAEHIEEGASILDYGCGTGEFLAYVTDVRHSVKSKGLDISATAVEMAQSLGVNASVLNPDEEIGKYDYVTCFEALEHIPEAEVILRQLVKSFRKQLIISIPNVGALNCRIRLAIFGRFPTTRCVMHVKEHVRHWTPKDFSEWVEQEGLRVVKIYGDWGLPCSPWRIWPSLFAKGIIYVLEQKCAATGK